MVRRAECSAYGTARGGSLRVSSFVLQPRCCRRARPGLRVEDCDAIDLRRYRLYSFHSVRHNTAASMKSGSCSLVIVQSLKARADVAAFESVIDSRRHHHQSLLNGRSPRRFPLQKLTIQLLRSALVDTQWLLEHLSRAMQRIKEL